MSGAAYVTPPFAVERCPNCSDVAIRHPGHPHCRRCGFDHRDYDNLITELLTIRKALPGIAEAINSHLHARQRELSSLGMPGRFERLVRELRLDIARLGIITKASRR